MQVTVGGELYVFAWSHIRGPKGNTTMCTLFAENKTDNEHCSSAIARCHPSDMFSKEAGRRISLARLLERVTKTRLLLHVLDGGAVRAEALRHMRAVRTAVWEEYWNCLPEKKRPKFRRTENGGKNQEEEAKETSSGHAEEVKERFRREYTEEVKGYRGKVPDVLLDSLVEWAVSARPTGSFLKAVLENDLRGALEAADEELLPNDVPLRQLWLCLFNRLPSGCFGSPGQVEGWQNDGGIVGKVLWRERERKENGRWPS